MLSVDLRAARKFTGHWSPHRPHTAISSVNCVGVSWKLKSTCQDQNNVSTSFISLNLGQPVPISAYDVTWCCRHRLEWFFSCHWLKVSRGLLLLFSSWKWSVQNCIKTLVNAHLYRTVIVVTFFIETRPYINISVEMWNQMFYLRIFLDFFSADSESMINVLLYPSIITLRGLGAFISFRTVIQYFCI